MQEDFAHSAVPFHLYAEIGKNWIEKMSPCSGGP